MKRVIVPVASVLVLLSGVSSARALTPTTTADRVAPATPLTPAAAHGLRVSPSDGTGGLLGPRSLVDRLYPADDTAGGNVVPDPFSGLAGASIAGYGAGTAFHTDAALAGKDRPADVDAAFAAASFASSEIPARLDELGREVAPALKPNRGFGRASSLDFTVADQKDDIDDHVDAEAPPGRGVTTKEPVPGGKLPPIFAADTLRSQASARSAAGGCVLGSDLAYGLAAADNTEVLDTRMKKDDPRQPMLSLSSDDPTRAVTQTVSRTRIVPPGVSGLVNFGLLSEVRQTIAPVTFDVGNQKFTVEVGGEWVLRAIADGARGTLTFGPDESSGDRPLLRVIDGQGHVVDEQDLAALTGKQAIVAGGITLFLGEDPRALGSVGEGPAKPVITATRVAAAMDVVRMQALDAENNPVQLRVGHTEVAVAVPPQGLPCPGIDLVKELDHPRVEPDQRFSWNITVANPNDCLLDDLKLEDVITTSDGVRYEIVATAPPSRLVGNGVLAFEGLGPLHGGGSRALRIDVRVAPDSPSGRFSDVATAAGTCHPDPVPGEGDTSIGVGAAAPTSVSRTGQVSLEGPLVQVGTETTGAAPVPLPTVSTNISATSRSGEGSIVSAAASGPVPHPNGASAGSTTGAAPRNGGLAATGGVALIPGAGLLGIGWLLRRPKRRMRRRGEDR